MQLIAWENMPEYEAVLCVALRFYWETVVCHSLRLFIYAAVCFEIVQVSVEIFQLDVDVHSHSVGSELFGCCLHTDVSIYIRIHKKNRSAIFYKNLEVISKLQFVCSAAVGCDPCTCLHAQYLPVLQKGCVSSESSEYSLNKK